MKQIIEERLKNSAKRALLGNTNYSILAIAVSATETKLIVKCFVNRIPTGEDYESLSDISAEMLSDFAYDELEEICEYSNKSIVELKQMKDIVVVFPENREYTTN